MRSEKKNVTYKLHKGRWRKVDYAMNYGWGRSSSYCVIENVFYHNFGTTIYWFDSQKRSWKILKGLESLCKSLCNKVLGGLWWENCGFVARLCVSQVP